MLLSVRSRSASIKDIQLTCWICPGQRWGPEYLNVLILLILVKCWNPGFISPLTFSDFVSMQNFFLLSSSMDKTVRLWHISRRECLCCFQHIDFVTAIAFHPRVGWVASICFSHHSRLFSLPGSYCLLCVPQDDRYFLSGSLDGKLRLWNIPDKKVALWNEVDGQTRLITAANFCQNGKYAVIGTYDGRCIFYDTEVPSRATFDCCRLVLLYRFLSWLRSFGFQPNVFFCFARPLASEIPHSDPREVHQRQEQSRSKNHWHRTSTWREQGTASIPNMLQSLLCLQPGRRTNDGTHSLHLKILVTSNDSRIRLYDLRDLSLSMKYKGYVNSSSQIKASFRWGSSFDSLAVNWSRT